MQRNSSLNKILINRFVIFVFLFIALTYYVFVFQFMSSMLDVYPGIASFFLIIFHISFTMMLWSLLTAMFTEPGKVPLYWGFFLDESDQKKKRFCLICHIFKPERCHHCSACNKCVLNMDHHCPWINNCIGFYNRKFFILMLFYVVTTLLIANLGMTIGIFEIFDDLDNFEGIYVLRIIVYLVTLPLFVVISLFLKFHINLILANTTTIENLDKKRSNTSNSTPPNTPNFDLGSYYNWVQVFGIRPILWPIPLFFGQYGKPAGDGIIWPQLPARESVKNIDMRDIESSVTNIDAPPLKYSRRVEVKESAKENNPNLANSNFVPHPMSSSKTQWNFKVTYQKFDDERHEVGNV